MLETERLQLIPLTAQQLKLWTEELPALEQELNCCYQAEPMAGFFLEIVKGQLARTQEDPTHYPWHSFWFLIRKSDRIVVGSADFKGLPDAHGEVEISYGLGKAFEHCGYMSEVVQALCSWAMEQEGVSHVIAETDLNGFASQQILLRCGFAQFSRRETLWWRL